MALQRISSIVGSLRSGLMRAELQCERRAAALSVHAVTMCRLATDELRQGCVVHVLGVALTPQVTPVLLVVSLLILSVVLQASLRD